MADAMASANDSVDEAEVERLREVKVKLVLMLLVRSTVKPLLLLLLLLTSPTLVDALTSRAREVEATDTGGSGRSRGRDSRRWWRAPLRAVHPLLPQRQLWVVVTRRPVLDAELVVEEAEPALVEDAHSESHSTGAGEVLTTLEMQALE